MFEKKIKKNIRGRGERFGQQALKMGYNVFLWKSFVVVKINKN